jgi:hypothetical protein
VNDKELAETFKIWEPLAKSPAPPGDDLKQDEIHFWLRDADPEDLWRAMRAVYLRGKKDLPF